MMFLYSNFDKKIGHYRRYNKKDKVRIVNYLTEKGMNVKSIKFDYFNPVGALGWFVKMKVLKMDKIAKKDAMIMNSIIPFIGWLDYLPFGFGQSMLIVIKKMN
ncbi:MAG: hypothetical protein NC925_02880 [Candidatus Omnitrophica bacterium]|nr:hypothetical protein [Candidatus Omnitrophota bacterium]